MPILVVGRFRFRFRFRLRCPAPLPARAGPPRALTVGPACAAAVRIALLPWRVPMGSAMRDVFSRRTRPRFAALARMALGRGESPADADAVGRAEPSSAVARLDADAEPWSPPPPPRPVDLLAGLPPLPLPVHLPVHLPLPGPAPYRPATWAWRWEFWMAVERAPARRACHVGASRSVRDFVAVLSGPATRVDQLPAACALLAATTNAVVAFRSAYPVRRARMLCEAGLRARFVFRQVLMRCAFACPAWALDSLFLSARPADGAAVEFEASVRDHPAAAPWLVCRDEKKEEGGGAREKRGALSLSLFFPLSLFFCRRRSCAARRGTRKPVPIAPTLSRGSRTRSGPLSPQRAKERGGIDALLQPFFETKNH